MARKKRVVVEGTMDAAGAVDTMREAVNNQGLGYEKLGSIADRMAGEESRNLMGTT